MKPTAFLISLAALSLPLLSACAAASHEDDAEDLRDTLAALPGVSEATLDYTEPVTLDSGKLALRVRMAADANPDAIADVVATTYDAFADAHHGEEGDLDVLVGDDTIHLRSFEPDAKVDAVKKAAANAIPVLASGTVLADINTQDVSKKPHVVTAYTVEVEKPGRDSVLQKLAELEKAHADIPDANWRVQAGGEAGWLLSAEKGFPGTEELTLFDELSEDLPEGTAILLYDDFATVQLPSGVPADEVSGLVGRHLQLLGGVEKAFYHVESGPELLAAITDGDCFFDTGSVGVRLEQDHEADCSKVTHPEV